VSAHFASSASSIRCSAGTSSSPIKSPLPFFSPICSTLSRNHEIQYKNSSSKFFTRFGFLVRKRFIFEVFVILDMSFKFVLISFLFCALLFGCIQESPGTGGANNNSDSNRGTNADVSAPSAQDWSIVSSATQVSECDSIFDPSLKDACLKRVMAAADLNNPLAVNAMSDWNKFVAASALGDASACESITNPSLKEFCIKEASK